MYGRRATSQLLLQRVEPVDLELAIADGERGAGGKESRRTRRWPVPSDSIQRQSASGAADPDSAGLRSVSAGGAAGRSCRADVAARSTAARETAVRSVLRVSVTAGFVDEERPGADLDPVAAKAARVAHGGPRETEVLAVAPDRHGADRRRPDRVAQEPALCVDDTEAEAEADRQRLAQVADGVGRREPCTSSCGSRRCRGSRRSTSSWR